MTNIEFITWPWFVTYFATQVLRSKCMSAAAAAAVASVVSDSVRPQRRQPTRLPAPGFSRHEHWSGLPFPSPMQESEQWKWSRSVMSDSWRPHGLPPSRLLHPWDSPGKNTGVGCHFLLQCMKVKSESEVAQSCPTHSNPMDCSLPGSSIHGFSRQEFWSRVPSPSPYVKTNHMLMQIKGHT